MKKLIIAAIFSISSFAWSETQSIGGPPWGGLNRSAGASEPSASFLIGDNEAQDLSNIDIGTNGEWINKRSPWAIYTTMPVSTAPVKGIHYFRSALGYDTLIVANDKNVYAGIDLAATIGLQFTYNFTFSAIITTDSAGSFYDFEDSNGTLWRADSGRDQIFSYDGAAVTYYPALPKGKQIEILPDRLVIAGSTNTTTIYFSAAGNFSDFTTGILDSSAFTEVVGLPGQEITAIKYVNGRLYIWSKQAFYFWEGTNQFNGIIQKISDDVGTLSPNGIINKDGILYWQAVNRSFYAFDGSVVQKISRKIDFVSGTQSGNTPDPVFGLMDMRGRLMWSQSVLGVSSPTYSYIYDFDNQAWLKYSYPIVAGIRFDKYLFFGQTSTSTLCTTTLDDTTQSGADGDNGDNSAYWKSKDFIGNGPYVEKDYKSISMISRGFDITSTTQPFNITYSINRSSITTTIVSTPTISSQDVLFSRTNQYLPNGKFGTFINFKFGVNSSTGTATSSMKIYSAAYEYIPRNWRVLP